MGGLPVDWTTSGSPAPFSLGPTAGTLAPGTSIDVVASVDRSSLPEGDYSASVSFAGGGSSVPVMITASMDRAPQMGLRSQPSTSYCTSQWGGFGISAAVSDESAVASVVLAWTDPSGASGSVGAQFKGSTWRAVNSSPATVLGTWSWSATATDARGNSTSQGGSFALDRC